ncbi:MAG TPA: carboxypeptidase-like regulatory domain-containing protein [Bryobacteraceae bacterium]|nr:carboxypeptidase-like regulatory domain-containing protein [Bryobacteraceae bacterium]
MHRKIWLVSFLALLLAAALAFGAKKDKDPEANLRTVQGTVTNAQDQPVDGAVVQLKNTKSLQVRSFITKEHGAYFFHGLSPDVDYELRAEYQNSASPAKTLSSFDSRKQAVMNLRLESKSK